MNKRVLFIGGSPCSGKSTVAERISKAYGAYYFKVDDLDKFTDTAAEKGYPVCKKSIAMTPDEIWMREPLIQCKDEFLIYDEISELVFEYLNKIDADFIVTEGAAYTPNVMVKYKKRNTFPSFQHQIFRYHIIKSENGFHIFWKGVQTNNRLFITGWNGIFCLRNK